MKVLSLRSEKEKGQKALQGGSVTCQDRRQASRRGSTKGPVVEKRGRKKAYSVGRKWV